MPRILSNHIAEAKLKTDNMSLAEKEAEFDIIFREQPNLLGSVIVQQQMGNTLEQMDVLLNLLLNIHLAFREAGVSIPTVSEELQEQELSRLVGQVKFTDGLDKQSFDTVLKKMIDNHPEKWLFSLAMHEVSRAGFLMLQNESSKYLVLCALNLVQCVAAVDLK